jgi:hypothetical protein
MLSIRLNIKLLAESLAMRDNYYQMKKVLAVILFIPVVIAGGISLSVITHNMQASSIKKQFGRWSHPPGTTMVREVCEVDNNVYGTGNQCDIFCYELRSFNGNIKNLQQFYANKTFILNGEKIKITPVPLTRDSMSQTDFDWLNDINQWITAKELENPHLYVVYIDDGGHSSLLDYRCY